MSGHVASLPCWHQVFDKWQKSESWSTTMGAILHNYDMEVGKMRELTVNELEEVSGAGISDALAYWGAAAAIGQFSYGTSWGTIAALAAIGFSPIAVTAVVGLALAGGYAYLSD